MLSRLEGEEHLFISTDSIEEEGDRTKEEYPEFFLNSMNLPSFPKHVLKIKIGAIVMCIRNLNLRGGICNGTRAIVTGITKNSIAIRLLAGTHKG